MTADLTTELVVRGTNHEISAVLRVIRAYVTDHSEIYLNSADLKTNAQEHDLRFLSENGFETLLTEVESAVEICADGPYGHFGWIEDISLFEDLANAAPTAELEGTIFGFASDLRQGANAELKNGILQVEFYYYFEREPEDCEGVKFAITGKLKHFDNREDIESFIEDYGGIVSESVSTKTNYLISNDKDGTSSKLKKARELGIPVITEEEFIKRFADPDEFDDFDDAEEEVQPAVGRIVYDPNTRTYLERHSIM